MRYVSSSSVATTRRRAVVLLVVMAMLALFAALGISFVFYADAVAVAAQTNRAAMAKEQAYIDPELLLAHCMGQLLYGTNSPYSSIQGHSLADTTWGNNPATLNSTPYNGPGRQDYNLPQQASFGKNIDWIHYMKFDSDGFQRRPGFYGLFTGTAADRYIESPNVPWTAPDRYNMFLSIVNADGKVVLPSFVRPWIPMDPSQTNLANMDRYKTLRPHGSWHPGFVNNLPDSETVLVNGSAMVLDVRNNDFGIGFQGAGTTIYNNDSIWMDLNFPIMTAANGKRYRPLFAPLVVDLSNRLNLWVHGNNMGTGGAHVSKDGFGVSEVNLSTPLNPVINALDIAKIFTMRGAVTGAPVPMPANGPWYAKFDFDGLNATTNGSASPFAYPSAGSNFFSPFPVFPTAATGGNENDATAAGTEAAVAKALGRNIFAAAGRPMAMSQMEWLLRQNGTNAPAVTSELARLFSNTFNDPADPTRRKRNMVTLWSSHLDRIAAPPVINFDPYDGNPATPRYVMTLPAVGNPMPPQLSPSITPITWNAPPASQSTNSEYTADWRSVLGNQLRINLNRPLSPYPAVDAASGVMIDAVAYKAAVADRQALATDLYKALVRITGATDPNNPAAAVPPAAPAALDPNSPSFRAARWLAQFAVNIVDFIDEDDYATPFPWYTNATTGLSDIVFGTELPRLVINEFYGQYDTEVAGVSPNCKLNVWLELHNPFSPSGGKPYPRDDGIAKLVQSNGQPIYQVVVCASEGLTTLSPGGMKLRDPANNTGEPDINIKLSTVTDWGTTAATQLVLPANGAFKGTTDGTTIPATTTGSNDGFYVVGPTATFLVPARNPNLSVTYPTSNDVANKKGLSIPRLQANAVGPDPVTVLLRRLANPHMPVNTTPTDPLYNPFITVDYMEDVLPGDNRELDDQGNATMTVGPTVFRAQGRRQPYGAKLLIGQSPFGWDMSKGQPKHTFFRHNSVAATAADLTNSAVKAQTSGAVVDVTLDYPFNWLTHLDRPLINPLELLHVSGYKPHELTQQFVIKKATDGTGNFQHYAPWGGPSTLTTSLGQTAQASMIYRLLEMVTTPNHLAGTYNGGAHPGRLNLNTITEGEIMQALADANNTNFTTADVDSIFARIQLARGNSDGTNQPKSDNRPLRGFAAANLAETLLRADPNDADQNKPTNRLFDLGTVTDHPYKRKALMQKILNNVSTTSNVFAVWWTVGYFEVVDETVRPAKLGAEIGRSENRHIRHRFFAIVDRSAMQVFSAPTTNPIAKGVGSSATINPTGIRTITTAVAGPPTLWSSTQRYSISDAVVFNNAGVLAPYICIRANTNTSPPNPLNWQPLLQPGMILEVVGATGAVGETVVVKTVSPTDPMTFTADFTLDHPGGASGVGPRLRLRGHPGPQSTYNPHRDSNVVLHMSVIK